MKLSVSSKQTYEKCQRSYYFHKILEASPDVDFVEPLYFKFGSAAHKCVEVFGYDGKNMQMQKIEEICNECGITRFDFARVAVSVRSYFAEWPKTNAISVEGWVDDDFIHGKYDGIVEDDEGVWILENKFKSAIDKDLGMQLTTDPQICAYASRAAQIKADMKLSRDLVGVIYRVVVKNSQTIGGARSHYDSPMDFIAKAKNGKTFELRIKFDEMSIGIVKTEMSMLCCEIEEKANKEEMFEKNEASCVWNEKKGEACKYYSRCHGMTYTESRNQNDEDLF